LILVGNIPVANQSETAIRVLRVANEVGKNTVALVAEEDKRVLQRFRSGEGQKVGDAYPSIPGAIHNERAGVVTAVHALIGVRIDARIIWSSSKHDERRLWIIRLD